MTRIRFKEYLSNMLRWENHFWSYFGVILLFLGVFQPLNGQIPLPYHYGVEQGLSTMFLYDLEIDEKGYLWIAGESGLLKYDGHEFVENPAGKLQSAEALRLYRAPDNSMWFLDLRGNICVYKNDSLSVIDSLGQKSDFQHIHFRVNDYGDQLITEKGFYNTFWKGTTQAGNRSERIRMPDSTPIGDIIKGYNRSFVLHSADKLIIARPGESKIIETPDHNLDGKSRIINWENKYLLNSGSNLYTFNPETATFEILFEQFGQYWENGVLGMYRDSRNDLWLSNSNGVFRVYKNNGNWEIQHFLKGKTGGDILEDWQGNVWLSTKQNGLYVLSKNALKFKFYEQQDLSINSIETDLFKNIYIGYEGGLVEKRNSNFELLKSRQVEKGNSRIYDLEYSEWHKGLFVAANNFIFLDDNFNLKREVHSSSCKAIEIATDHSIWFGSSIYLGIMEDKPNYKLARRSYAVYPIDKENAYGGTLKGLVKIQSTAPYVIDTVAGIKKDVRTLAKDNNNNIWVGTQGSGVIIMQNDAVVNSITMENGLPSNKCSKIEIDENFAWILTPENLVRVGIDNYGDIEVIGKSKGLNAFHINDFTVTTDDVLVATDKGIFTFNKNLTYTKDSICVYIANLEINDEKVIPKEYLRIRGKENKIRLDVGTISFLNSEGLEYAYKLEGMEKEWNIGKEKFIQYVSVAPGEYKLRWKARLSGEKWFDGSPITLEIKPKFSETVYAKILVLLAALLSGGIIFWLFNKNKNQSRKLRNQLHQARIMSVRARMNPHFVFNALNSIQDFIIHANIRDANRYLGRFSNLMRNVLFSSEQSAISLEKELETLDLYLSLEQLRFEGEFHYTIDIEPSINVSEILIPSMMIQPHVENAIKHGLLHKKGTKELTIKILSDIDKLIVEVIDNGIGRKAAKLIREKSELPVSGRGMELSEKQLALINNFQREVHSVVVTDLMDENNLAVGTKVKLILSLASFQHIIQFEKNKPNAQSRDH